MTKKGEMISFIDFKDKNEAYPEDEFLLPITNVMIDNNTCEFESMSLINGFS